MGEISCASRTPNYFGDIEYGKIAELDFERNMIPVFEKLGYKVFDVWNVSEYQYADIDYVVDKTNGIAVSTVQASYTSKMCPICGCIEDENRPNQETFECVECGHKDNADVNAAINIRNRVLVTVLRDSLLKQLGNGAFEPKNLKRDEVKKTLLSFRRSLLEKAESEHT